MPDKAAEIYEIHLHLWRYCSLPCTGVNAAGQGQTGIGLPAGGAAMPIRMHWMGRVNSPN